MALKSILLSLLAPAAALVAVPAMAQAPATGGGADASLPTCSAKVTDHCMQRGAGHMTARHMKAHHGKHHVKARHHHKARKHHAVAKAAAAPAAPAPAKPAKPKG